MNKLEISPDKRVFRKRNQGKFVATPAMPAWYWRIVEDRYYNSNSLDISFLYGRCPYLNNGGLCSMGCLSEPGCIAGGCSPDGGWPLAPLVIRRVEQMRDRNLLGRKQ